ncbi:MAG: carboxymuconolactone decarboxylase family protein [Vicinamibacteria bacterium]
MAQASPAPSPSTAIAISRAGSREVQPAPAENFTGRVRVERLFDARDPSHASGGSVAFEPGARTAWHSHPRGQILVVTAGTGRVQLWGSRIEEIQAGDVVRIPAGRKHWHGAGPRTSMTHLAVSEHRDGTAVEWLEKVSDEQYGAAAAPEPPPAGSKPSGTVQPRIAPGLAALTDDVLFGDVWKRPDLSPRDRSLVTISVLIATGKAAQLTGHLGRALDNGVKPSEASGLLAHLAIYSGWPNAVSALEVYDQVYGARNVDTATLRAQEARLPVAGADPARAQALAQDLGALAPKFVQLTDLVVFDDLWRRSDLSRRDRSLATIAALAAMGDDDQLDPYLHGGIESGLTRAEIAEAVTHLAFYAGWARSTKAMNAVARSLGK